MAHETIIDGSEITVGGQKFTVTIDHLLDDKDEDDPYTGCYRATLSNGNVLRIELKDDVWIETDKGASEFASAIGKLIENYVE